VTRKRRRLGLSGGARGDARRAAAEEALAEPAAVPARGLAALPFMQRAQAAAAAASELLAELDGGTAVRERLTPAPKHCGCSVLSARKLPQAQTGRVNARLAVRR